MPFERPKRDPLLLRPEVPSFYLLPHPFLRTFVGLLRQIDFLTVLFNIELRNRSALFQIEVLFGLLFLDWLESFLLFDVVSSRTIYCNTL